MSSIYVKERKRYFHFFITLTPRDIVCIKISLKTDFLYLLLSNLSFLCVQDCWPSFTHNPTKDCNSIHMEAQPYMFTHSLSQGQEESRVCLGPACIFLRGKNIVSMYVYAQFYHLWGPNISAHVLVCLSVCVHQAVLLYVSVSCHIQNW